MQEASEMREKCVQDPWFHYRATEYLAANGAATCPAQITTLALMASACESPVPLCHRPPSFAGTIVKSGTLWGGLWAPPSTLECSLHLRGTVAVVIVVMSWLVSPSAQIAVWIWQSLNFLGQAGRLGGSGFCPVLSFDDF